MYAAIIQMNYEKTCPIMGFVKCISVIFDRWNVPYTPEKV